MTRASISDFPPDVTRMLASSSRLSAITAMKPTGELGFDIVFKVSSMSLSCSKLSPDTTETNRVKSDLLLLMY